MRGVLGRATLCVPAVARRAAMQRCLARPFSAGDDDASAGRRTVGDAREPVASTKSQQRKAYDRPWLRESSNALPEATSNDPAAGYGTKSTAPRRLPRSVLTVGAQGGW